PSPAITAPSVAARLSARRRRRRWLLLFVVCLLPIATLLAWRWMRHGTAVEYVTAPVTRGDVTRAITASGTVNPQTTGQVGTYVSGTVQAIYCDYNTQVKKGQLCAKIDPRPYQTTVDQDRANLESAKAQLEKDKANLVLQEASFKRSKQLYDAQLISRD